MMNKDFITIKDLTIQDIEAVFSLSRELKKERSKFQDALQIIDRELSPVMLVRSEFAIVYTAIFASFEEFQQAEAQFISGMNKADISFNTEFQYFL